MPIKVNRARMARIFKKPPFRAWLDAQQKKELTYTVGRSGSGWSAEDFYLEARHLGAPVSFYTILSWCRGIKPRRNGEELVRAKFKSVQF